MPSTRKERLLVLRAQSGDRDAMNQLFVAVQDPLYRFLRSLGADAHRAEDLLQETFVTIYRKIRWLREPDLFRAWSFRIAHRLTARRMAKERRELDRFEVESDVDEVPGGVELDALPEGGLTELVALASPSSKPVLVLHFEHGLELAQIADVLELPLGTVKSRLGYGLRALRKVLAARAARGGAR